MIVWYILYIVFYIITIGVLKDTKKRTRIVNSAYRHAATKESKLKITVLCAIMISILYIIPYLNVVAFAVFVISSAIFYTGERVTIKQLGVYEAREYFLMGNNPITKILLWIKRILLSEI